VSEAGGRIDDHGRFPVTANVIQPFGLCELQIPGAQLTAEFARSHSRSVLRRCRTMGASFSESLMMATTLGDAVIGSPRRRIAATREAAIRRAPRCRSSAVASLGTGRIICFRLLFVYV